MSHCIYCGRELPEGSQFCNFCGSAQTEDNGFTPQTQNKPTILPDADASAYQNTDTNNADFTAHRQMLKKACPLWPYLLAGILTFLLLFVLTVLLRLDTGSKGVIILLLLLTVVPSFVIAWAIVKRRYMKRMGLYARKHKPAAPSISRMDTPIVLQTQQTPPVYSQPEYSQRSVYQLSKPTPKKKRTPAWVKAIFGFFVVFVAASAIYAGLTGQTDSLFNNSDSGENSVKPASESTTLSGRWDGDTASGAMNGYSIVFYNGRAYFGITYEDDDYIINNGLELTYTISGNQITFNSVSDNRSVVMTYSGSTITDNADPEKCAFEAGYVFTKQ